MAAVWSTTFCRTSTWYFTQRYPRFDNCLTSSAICRGGCDIVQAAMGTQDRTRGPISFQAGSPNALPIRS